MTWFSDYPPEHWNTHCRFCGGKLSDKGHALIKNSVGDTLRVHTVCKTIVENVLKPTGNPSR